MRPMEATGFHAPVREPQPTIRGVPTPSRTGNSAIWFRRAFMALLAVIVVLGLFGFLGVKSQRSRPTRDPDSCRSRFTTRRWRAAGLGVPFVITVHRQGGFRGEVVLEVTSSYLDLFDRSSIDPEPASETATASASRWRFAPPQATRWSYRSTCRCSSVATGVGPEPSRSSSTASRSSTLRSRPGSRPDPRSATWISSSERHSSTSSCT